MKKFFTLALTAMLGLSAASAEEVTLYAWDSTAQAWKGNAVTEISFDGTNYVISNFENSGGPVSFTFEKPESVGNKTAITLSEDCIIPTYPNTPYLAMPGLEEYMTLQIPDADDASKLSPVYYPIVYLGQAYTNVEKIDKEVYGSDYYGTMVVMGYDSEEGTTATPYYYIYFYFNDLASGVEDINANNDAPVTFYDMTGRQVSNPTNGIYVRRQGNTTTKVMIR